MADPKINADVAALPFEQALQQLEQIVARLESGNVALEDSIEIYARGQALKERCDHLLKTAEARIEKIAVSADGQASGTSALDPER
ncbi:MAG: exodeoxyribonuclease VII small subunit [Nitrospiraceae bacterium]|nr:exodeoxyribonuclease VII small subunit [Nitrospiraceae bacterium]